MTKHTESSVAELLREKYSPPAWAFLTGVPDATGFSKSRTADAIAMSLWPSKGLHLYGFEIKVSRSDWLKEIQDPSKAETFARYCHVWQIVAPKGIVKVEELPPEWGLLEITDRGNLRAKKAVAPTEPRAPLSVEFVAALLRSVSKLDELQIARERQQGRQAAIAEAKELAESELKRQKRLLEHLQKNLDAIREAFRTQLGFDPDPHGWNLPTELAHRIRLTAELQKMIPRGQSIAGMIRSIHQATADCHQNASNVLAGLEAVLSGHEAEERTGN